MIRKNLQRSCFARFLRNTTNVSQRIKKKKKKVLRFLLHAYSSNQYSKIQIHVSAAFSMSQLMSQLTYFISRQLSSFAQMRSGSTCRDLARSSETEPETLLGKQRGNHEYLLPFSSTVTTLANNCMHTYTPWGQL